MRHATNHKLSEGMRRSAATLRECIRVLGLEFTGRPSPQDIEGFLAGAGYRAARRILREWPRLDLEEFLSGGKARRMLGEHGMDWMLVRIGGGSGGRWRIVTPDGLYPYADPREPHTQKVDHEIDHSATVRECILFGSADGDARGSALREALQPLAA